MDSLNPNLVLILGIIIGLLIAILIVLTLTYFRRVIEHRVNVVEKQIDIKSPRPRGFIVEPKEPGEDVREQIKRASNN